MFTFFTVKISTSMKTVTGNQRRVTPSAIATKDGRDGNTAGSFCLQCVLFKHTPAFSNRVEGFVGISESNVVQVKIGDKPNRSVPRVKSVPGTILHGSLAVDSVLLTQ